MCSRSRLHTRCQPYQGLVQAAKGHTGDDIEHVAEVHRRRNLLRILALDERLEHANCGTVDVSGQERYSRARAMRVVLQLFDEPVTFLLPNPADKWVRVWPAGGRRARTLCALAVQWSFCACISQ